MWRCSLNCCNCWFFHFGCEQGDEWSGFERRGDDYRPVIMLLRHSPFAMSTARTTAAVSVRLLEGFRINRIDVVNFIWSFHWPRYPTAPHWFLHWLSWQFTRSRHFDNTANTSKNAIKPGFTGECRFRTTSQPGLETDFESGIFCCVNTKPHMDSLIASCERGVSAM